MRMRVALALSLALPSLAAWIAAGPMPEVAQVWWLLLTGLAPALAWWVALRRGTALLLVAGGLAGLAAGSTAKARVMLDVSGAAQTEGAFPFHDLRDGGLPEPLPPYLRISGYVHSGWTLDEYAVERGDLPDQSAEPIAVLMPITGSPPPPQDGGEQRPREHDVKPGQAVVAVRVAPKAVFVRDTPTVLQGKTQPLELEVLTTLVQVQGDASELRGVLLDTLAIPSRQDAWLELGLAAIALLVAMGCGFAASGPLPESA